MGNKHFQASILTLMFILMIGLWQFKKASEPVIRRNTKAPAYAIGDHHYDRGLEKGRVVLKFGPILWGLIAGGVAFESPEAAAAHIHETGMQTDQWGVFRLSGDYRLDVEQKNGIGYMKKTMLVLEKINVNQQTTVNEAIHP
ncbi:MAG: hypothetical protein JRH15_10935 [Deltaproteobacteria bacterium]|nr:hypothetical protein [Deltaproteobacteria bacterium]